MTDELAVDALSTGAPTAERRSPAVEMVGIRKRFGAVQALSDASFVAARGEVHALLGENGAGKTTLMNVLSGLYLADAGQVSIDGAPARITTPLDATRRGIGMVHQHPELIGAFTGYENIALAAPESRLRQRFDRGRDEIGQLIERYGLPVDLRRRVFDLAMGERQKIEILRELYRGATILILDEPTTHLTPSEFDGLFSAIRKLADSGFSAILISHKLHEVFAVADQITVLRRGRTVGCCPRSEVTADGLVRMMLGDASADHATRVAIGASKAGETDEAGDQAVETVGADERADSPVLALRGVRSGDRLRIEELTVRPGEIMGVAGVAGNGQKDLLDVLVGTAPLDAGSIILRGRDVSRATVASRLRAGLAVLPDDRLREGALPASPLWQTYWLGLHKLLRARRWDPAELKRQTQSMISEFALAAQSPDDVTADLSGGTLQRALVARALAILSMAGGGVLVAINPTQGLDVGGVSFVREHLVRIRRQRGAVLLVSEDLEELFELSDRIAVLLSGSITAEYTRAQFDRQRVGASMVGAAHG